MAPDLKRKVDATRAARQAREEEIRKQIDAQVWFFFPLSPSEIAFYWLSFSLHVERSGGATSRPDSFYRRSVSELISFLTKIAIAQSPETTKPLWADQPPSRK